MISYKVFLDIRRIKLSNKYPVVIRVTHDRRTTCFYTGISVIKTDWDANTGLISKINANYKDLNFLLTKKFLSIQKAVLTLENANNFTFEKLKELLSEKPQVKAPHLSFYLYSQNLINKMLELKQTGNALVYQTAVNRFVHFVGNNTFRFSDIDFNVLNDYRNQLSLDGAKPNTISNYFRTIRAIYNKAIKSGIVNRSLYPFYDISFKQERTAKRSIRTEDLKKLISLNLKLNSPEWHARNYFILSFSLIGMSFTDMAYLKPGNIINGRLIYKRRKTHKSYDIRITSQAKTILNQYNSSKLYLLPVLYSHIEENSLKANSLISQWIKTTNKYLKRLGKECNLGKPLTTYVARHTWATISKRLGYSNELIAEALGHETGNRITNIYLDTFDQSEIDNLNETVLKVLLDKN